MIEQLVFVACLTLYM